MNDWNIESSLIEIRNTGMVVKKIYHGPLLNKQIGFYECALKFCIYSNTLTAFSSVFGQQIPLPLPPVLLQSLCC